MRKGYWWHRCLSWRLPLQQHCTHSQSGYGQPSSCQAHQYGAPGIALALPGFLLLTFGDEGLLVRLLSSTGLQKRFLVETEQGALAPGERFGQLCSAIEPIHRAPIALPLGRVLPDHLQEMQVFTCLAYPLRQAFPLANHRLVADFQRRRSCYLVGRQQTSCNESIGGLAQPTGRGLVRERELRERSTAAGGVLLGGSRVDQAQQQRTCQSAMLLGG